MKSKFRRFAKAALPLLMTLLAPAGAHAELPQVDIGARFREEQVEGTFVLLDGQTGAFQRHDEARAAQRYLPASTYKIPNSLIALETGEAKGKDYEIEWDSKRAPRQPWWPAAWAQNHTLESALQNSAVWYYQEIARRIGPERMQAYVDRFNYGNRDISGGIDKFWLTGSLRISANEQVEFLRRFYVNQFGLSERTVQTTKDMLVLEQTPDYRLSGKTGWAGFGEAGATQTAWLVGYLERQGDVFYFAVNVNVKKSQDAAARMKIVRGVFGDLGLLSSAPPALSPQRAQSANSGQSR
ncbi:class D beta-lactamase [Achromobacter insolitus]|uniref:class D beta-lactamase n=1 Tax=Achromobacter insolitus TaxID=217204 RepID=UPI00174C02D7|nr:class D beta-lactamase [Achromobacter insolitus]